MFYPFDTAVLVDLLLTSIIFPRIQTLAESVNDFDKKGIAFGGWSMKLLTAFWFSIIQAFWQFWHACKVHREWSLTKDRWGKGTCWRSDWEYVQMASRSFFIKNTNRGRKWKYFATSSEGFQLCHVDSHMWFVGHNMFYLTQVCLRLHIIYPLTHWCTSAIAIYLHSWGRAGCCLWLRIGWARDLQREIF